MTAVIGIAFVVFLALIFLRLPIAYAIGVAGLLGYYLGDMRLDGAATALTAGLESFPLLAIPAFLFAGDLMAQGGISNAIIDLIQIFLKRFRGGLGSVLVSASMLFGAITGSSLATISAIGGIMYAPMLKDGYSRPYITALLAASGFLGILVPPSVPGVVYSLVTEQKVTDIWISTLMPGITLGLLYVVVNYLVFGRKQPRRASAQDMAEFGSRIAGTLPKASVAFVMPLIIFGGVYGGVFTATEAGAVSVFYGLIAGWIIYPLFFKMKADGSLASTARKTAITTASICIIIATATIFGRMITLAGLTETVTRFLMSITESKYVFLIVVNIVLLLCGMFLETNSVIILFSPLFSPVAVAYGVDPIQFGAIMLLNLEIGMITPPFAANIFVASRLTGCRLDEVIKPLLPFYAACIPVLLLTTFVPGFSLFFVRILS
jgi:C4-dicarboxylate transporter DctM subunit